MCCSLSPSAGAVSAQTVTHQYILQKFQLVAPPLTIIEKDRGGPQAQKVMRKTLHKSAARNTPGNAQHLSDNHEHCFSNKCVKLLA